MFDWSRRQPQARQEWRELTQRTGMEGARLLALRSAGLARMFEELSAAGRATPLWTRSWDVDRVEAVFRLTSSDRRYGYPDADGPG